MWLGTLLIETPMPNFIGLGRSILKTKIIKVRKSSAFVADYVAEAILSGYKVEVHYV